MTNGLNLGDIVRNKKGFLLDHVDKHSLYSII